MKLSGLTAKTLKISLFAGAVIFTSSYGPLNTDPVNSEKDTVLIRQADSSEMAFNFGSAMPPQTDMITIPLKGAGRLFMLEAVIDNQKGNLIFDTGASGLVLNRTYFRKYLKLDEQQSNGITGNVGQVDKINVAKMNISGLTYDNTEAALADLGHIENKRGVKVMGLIGFELFKDFEVVIDLNGRELQLHRLDLSGKRKSSASPAFIPDYSQKIDFYKNIVFLKASIGGKILKFCFDTGAETNAINHHSTKNVLNSIAIESMSNLRGAGSTSVEVLFGTIRNFKIGDHSIPDMETIITNLDPLIEAYGVQIDGMLGYNFISQGVISFNFVKKQMDIKFVKAN